MSLNLSLSPTRRRAAAVDAVRSSDADPDAGPGARADAPDRVAPLVSIDCHAGPLVGPLSVDAQTLAAAPANRPEFVDMLAQIPLFAHLDAPRIRYLAGHTRKRRLAKGEFLYQKGDDAKWMFAVGSGQLKLALQSQAGNEKVVCILGPQETTGESAIHLRTGYLFGAQAVCDSLIFSIAREAILQIQRQDSVFAQHIVTRLATQIQFLVAKFENSSLLSGAQRVMAYLLSLCPDGQSEGSVEVHLPVSKVLMASELNLTPEHLSRILRELAEEAMIVRAGRSITLIDCRRLRAAAQLCEAQ